MVKNLIFEFDETLYPTEVLIHTPDGGLKKDSVVLLNQVRSIDKQDFALQLSFGLIEI